MLQSTITRKGQTTIPKEIRAFLNLKPNDTLFYIVDEDKVILKPLHGDILDLRGSVPAGDRPSDINTVRDMTKKKVAQKIAEEI